MITAGIGRFGPYLKLGDRYKNLTPDEDVLSIGLNRAVDLLADEGGAGGGRGLLRGLGEHPADKKPVTLNKGRFGPYVKHGSVMASLPRKYTPEEITLEQAIELLTAKAGAAPSTKGKPGKSAPAKRATAKADAPAAAKAPVKPAAAKAPVKKAATKAVSPAGTKPAKAPAKRKSA